MTLLELSARGVDVVAAGVADRRLDAVHLQALLQGLDFFHRRRLHQAAGRVVELDEVHVAQRTLAEVDQRFHLGVRIVDAIDHGELVARTTSGLLDVQLDGLVQAGERVLLHTGHELVARGLYGGVQRDSERELLGKFGKAADAGDDTAGGDRQMACSDCEAVGIVEDAQRSDGLVEVGERFALTHEDDARDSLIEVACDMEHLVDDLAGGEGTGKPVETGGAKRAPHGAARLRGNADRKLVARGHPDGFH